MKIMQSLQANKSGLLGAIGLLLLAVTAPVNAQKVGDLLQMREDIHPNGSARYIDAAGLQGRAAFASGSTENRALLVAKYYKAKLGITNPARDLAVVSVKSDLAGNTHVRLRQRYRGLGVDGAGLTVHFNRAGEPTSVTASAVPNIALASTNPTISGRTAAQAALAGTTGLSVSNLKLVIYNEGLPRGRAGTSQLAYKVTVAGEGAREFVYVNAADGSVIDRYSGIHIARNRLTYDMNGTSSYGAANLERTENDPPVGDQDVDDAHDFAADTYDFFFNSFGRDSIDNAGMALRSYTHYGSFICPNAFWDGFRMTYCDGFPTDDVTGHEITHGVIERTADLVYSYQPGALNESFADIFGETIDLINGAGTDTADVRWQLGEDLPVFGTIRNLANPPEFGDPDRVNSPLYYCGSGDNGGVHYNSGVPNKNYTLLVDGGTFNGRTVQPLGLIKASAVHYQALTSYHSVNTQFRGHFVYLWRACQDLIGVDLPHPLTGDPSGQVLSFPNCVQFLLSGLATELPAPACQ